MAAQIKYAAIAGAAGAGQAPMPVRRRALAEVRQKLGMTQREFADRVGISASHLVQIESGGRTPSLPVALRIARLAKAAGISNPTVENLFALRQPSFPEGGEDVD